MHRPDELYVELERSMSSFSSRQLELITNQWRLKVGEGGDGVVYNGFLPLEFGGNTVAVKWAKQQR